MDSNLVAVPTPIAEKINAEHEACCQAASNALDHAIRCGELLLEAKATVGHGGWNQWLADRFVGSARTARAYMQLARRRGEIESKRHGDTVFSVNEARRLI